MEIKMVDLKGQYDKIKEEINTGIQEVIDTTSFINGSHVKQFAKNLENYLSVKHVIPCANGTDALQIALMALNLKPGDEVITPNFTFIATVEVIKLLGLKPVYVDVDSCTFTIDTNAIEKVITDKTKAIIPVHLFGQCANMDEIMRIAESKKIFVIEDTAQATGADYFFENGSVKKAGTIGHIGCTSFFPSKNLGCYGDGGAIMTNSDELAGKMKMFANHGSKVKYYHDTIGVNSRLDTIQAAILNVKLKYLDKYNKARQAAAEFYDNKLKSLDKLEIPVRFEKSSHIFHQYTLKLETEQLRDDLKEFLNIKGIPSMIYYPIPMHLQKAYLDDSIENINFPITESLCKTVLSLPIHTELDKEQLKYITDSVIEYFEYK